MLEEKIFYNRKKVSDNQLKRFLEASNMRFRGTFMSFPSLNL